MALCLRSDAQALAALGAARVEHGAAAAGLHAHEETVRAGAADFGRLVGALHGRPVSVVAEVAGLGVGGFKPGLPASFLPAWRLPAWLLANGARNPKLAKSAGGLGFRPVWGAHHLTFVLRQRPRFEFGKPTITAKIAFAVKHLHHKPLCSTGVDDVALCVDNCVPPIARDA